MPPGTGALFTIQIFSTLSYSVLYSTLVFYITQGLGMSDAFATSLTGAFIALNYFLHLIGGYIGGRLLSYRSLFSVGMGLQAIGCLLLSLTGTSYFFWGLAAFLSGSGLNSTCINCMITQLFEPNDKRRETMFLWNYSGMNAGFFIGFMVSGYYYLQGAYHHLFLLSGLGNLIALILAIANWQHLNDRNTSFTDLPATTKARWRLYGISSIVCLLIALRLLLNQPHASNQLVLGFGTVMLAWLVIIIMKEPSLKIRHQLWAFILLSFASIVFWALYQLAPMGLNLFIERNVDRHYLGVIVAPQWVQSLNTLIIIAGGPLLSHVFTRMRKRGMNINIPAQFTFALFAIGAAYAILPLGIAHADTQGLVNFNWILAAYVLQSLGELFISPIGYAMVGQLAPLRLRGTLMGMWMMLTGIAAIFSNYFSKMAASGLNNAPPALTNASYSTTFGLLGAGAIAAGFALWLLTPLIKRLTQPSL